jgi:outer membrane protein OmpA-like peptidoglycan-associated protein
MMIRKILFPVFAVAALGLAFSFNGCSCHAEAGTGAQTPPTPSTPPPPPPPEVIDAGAPPPPPPPAPKVAATGKTKLEGTRVRIPGELEFDVGKATLKSTPQTTDILTELVSFMTSNKAVSKLRVEGHTDNSGNQVANVKLSQERADAVVKYLTGKGIDAGRLTSVGYGSTRPVSPNDTAANKALNRRTEFHVQEIEGKQQGDLPALPNAQGTGPVGAAGATTTTAAPAASAKPAH